MASSFSTNKNVSTLIISTTKIISHILIRVKERQHGLLDLPPEIWSKIVKLAVVYDSPLKINTMPIKVNVRNQCRKVIKVAVNEPGITRVRHNIREECLRHFYKVNTFYHYTTNGNTRRLSKWLDCIDRLLGKRNIEALGEVYQFEHTGRKIEGWQLTDRGLYGTETWQLQPLSGEETIRLLNYIGFMWHCDPVAGWYHVKVAS